MRNVQFGLCLSCYLECHLDQLHECIYLNSFYCIRFQYFLSNGPLYKFNSRWIKDLNIRQDTLNLTEEKVGNSLEMIGIQKDFLNRIPTTQVLRSTINTEDVLAPLFFPATCLILPFQCPHPSVTIYSISRLQGYPILFPDSYSMHNLYGYKNCSLLIET